MTAATVTGTTELSTSAWSLEGNLVLNGVRIALFSDGTEAVVKTVNRFKAMSGVTASAGSSDSKNHLVLTSEDPVLRVDGDQNVLGALGLVPGVTEASTAAPAAPAATPPSTA